MIVRLHRDYIALRYLRDIQKVHVVSQPFKGSSVVIRRKLFSFYFRGEMFPQIIMAHDKVCSQERNTELPFIKSLPVLFAKQISCRVKRKPFNSILAIHILAS